ncbi:MAG: isochorismatase family protein [Acidimicrobiia bacterium]
MATEISSLIAAPTTALLLNEVQPPMVSGESALGIAGATILPNIVRLVDVAREAGVQVMHCVKVFRTDALARNRNTPLYRRMGVLPDGPVTPDSTPVPGSFPAPEVGPDERDLVMTRLHGMGAVTDTGVVPVLRNLGITTVVVVGVSLNVGVLNTAMDLMNHAFEVVVPRDAVVGLPEEYGRMVIDHTLKAIATITTTDAVVDAWQVSARR